ncbi:hypothetical protein CAFE_31370 [Caprobacter fermentans]|uniref:Uncharacterized protein n=1 Tax=Caproicibacter fermentans TaxID=2576756 RepID=A0A6N8I2N8_9FIRM|nr:hypothetical protein [Caproicibacter fermentans]MVB12401.1 hypothetical protein [Caproicibacter fermentans]
MKKLVSLFLALVIMSTASIDAFAATTSNVDADIASSKTTSIKDSDLQYLETAFSILMEAPDEFLKTASDTEIRDYFKLKGLGNL